MRLKKNKPIPSINYHQIRKNVGGGGMEEQETLNRCCLYKVDQRQNYKVEK